MIQGIRRKFILIAAAVLSVTMITLAIVINVSNWIQVRGEMEETLADLAENPANDSRVNKGFGKKGRDRHMQSTLEESRYFTVRVLASGEYLVMDASRSAGETEEEMAEMARTALASGNRNGMTGHYMYLVSNNKGNNNRRKDR